MAGYATGGGNRITSDGTWTYVHDAEGNITKKTLGVSAETWTYGYDHRNQMIWAEKWSSEPPPSGGGVLQMRADYEYDVFGNGVEKRVDPDGVGGQGTTTTRFAHEMWQTGRVPGAGRRATRTGTLGDRAELDGSNNLKRRLVAQHGEGVDQLFARIDAQGNAAWYLADHLGSITDIVNASGTVINHTEYDSFGRITAETGTPYGDRLKYTGREWSAGTGLYYYRARWYDPTTGRFMSEDPSGFPDGPNRWVYVMNNPLNLTDPSGLEVRIPMRYLMAQKIDELREKVAGDEAAIAKKLEVLPGKSGFREKMIEHISKGAADLKNAPNLLRLALFEFLADDLIVRLGVKAEGADGAATILKDKDNNFITAELAGLDKLKFLETFGLQVEGSVKVNSSFHHQNKNKDGKRRDFATATITVNLSIKGEIKVLCRNLQSVQQTIIRLRARTRRKIS